MARKRKYRRSRKMTVPIAPIVGLIAAPAVRGAAEFALKGDFGNAMAKAGHIVGIQTDGKFNFQLLSANMSPIIIGALVHKFVGGSPLNLNKTLANAGVPYIRI